MKILVVDDDPAILLLCARALERMGHSVTTCQLGAEALAAALDGQFDLALCDLALPDVHGVDVVRAIKERAPELPVIVMSALDRHEWSAKAGAAGADHFLAKPLRLDVLRHEVSMAARARVSLRVALFDADAEHGRMLAEALRRGGCEVTVADDASALLGIGGELVILDAAAAGADDVVRRCRRDGRWCFVLFDAKNGVDERLLRNGASLVVAKPVDPEALLIQARFLATR